MADKTSQSVGLALARIRDVTGGAHQSLESALDLLHADLPRYRQLIADFFGFYEPIEQLATCYAQPGWLDDVDRRKTRLLRADLASLRFTPDVIAALPRCQNLPPTGTDAEQLGCMYVLEGSTLGGQHISRRLLPALGLSPDNGGQFFSSYRDQVGVRWRDLLMQLESRLQAPALRDAAANSALQTFTTLQRWLTRRT